MPLLLAQSANAYLISHLVVVLTRKLEILVTTLGERQLFLVTVYMERGKSYLQGPRNILEGRSSSAFGLHAKGCALVPGAKIFLVLGSSKLRDR